MTLKPDPIRNIIQRAGFTIFATLFAVQVPMIFLPTMTRSHPLESLTFSPPSALLYALAFFQISAVTALFYYWRREKKTLMRARKEEIARVRREATVETLQKTMAVVAERIGAPNAETLKWVNERQRGGNQVSRKVEVAAQSIAAAVRDLAELAFVRPYAAAVRTNNGAGEMAVFVPAALPVPANAATPSRKERLLQPVPSPSEEGDSFS